MQPVPFLSGPRGGSVSLANIFATMGGEDGVTAFATGGQTNATQLLSTVSNHRVSTVVTAADSVKLPAATVGQEHYVRNDGAASMQVFGQATETINGVASATGISQAPGMGVLYVCTTAGAWTTSPATLITATGGMLSAAAAGAGAGYGFVGSNTSTGLRSFATDQPAIYAGTSAVLRWIAGQQNFASNAVLGWENGSANVIGGTVDVGILRAAANSLMFTGGSAATTTSRTEMNKAVTAFTDAVAKTVFTLTIPNAAHSASYYLQVTGSLGAGGAIGANEASATNCYIVTLTRTPGVAAVATISAAFGAAACAVAGAATVTCVATLAAVSGGVGATNTIDVQATITRSGGTSANHTCVATISLLNANASGITVA